MIPVRDIVPSRTTPVVTLGLIAMNAAVFLYGWLAPDGAEALTRPYQFVAPEFSLPRAMTGMFVHVQSVHLLGNLLTLWIFGENVEDRLGHGRFLLFYLVAGVAAAAFTAWTAGDSATIPVGASGAIAGVMAAYLVLFPRSRVLLLFPLIVALEILEVPATMPILVWLLLQIAGAFGTLGGPANVVVWSLAGGFTTGFALVWLLRRRERERVDWWLIN